MTRRTQDSGAEAQWQALLGAAILGADRGGGHDGRVDGACGAMLQAAKAEDPAETMLAQAAILSVYCRAGRRIARGDGHAPEPAPRDDGPVCSDKAGRQLAAILFEGFSELLPEWCALAAAAGLRAPDELLPALLHRLESHARSEGAAIRSVLGARGSWLAAQHPDWSPAGSGDAERAWDGGDIEDRVAALSAIRRGDPGRGRDMLAESWDGEAAGDRARLLAALAEGLSEADEDFLESALDDRRAEVRQAAAELLALLPGSRYAARMGARVGDLVKLAEKRGLLGGKAVLAVTLPDQLDKAMKRDGLSDRQHSGLGKKASLLMAIVAGTPLGAWSGAQPADWTAAAAKSDWRDALIWGWSRAAARQSDVPWGAALLGALQGLVKSARHLETHRPALLAAMASADPATRENAVTNRLGGGDSHVAGILLSACDHAWSRDFSARVLAWLKTRFPERPADGWQLRELVKKDFARHMDPALATEAATGWRTDRNGWSSGLDDMVDRFVRCLEFRMDMRKELKP